jgi:formiminoglutamase
VSLHQDPKWTRAGAWLDAGAAEGPLDIGVLGVPAHESSLSPTQAHLTPDAVRASLHRYSTFSARHDRDLQSLRVADLGSVIHPDGPDGEERVREEVRLALVEAAMVVCIGGDNSITYPIALGAHVDGVITFDAHHDVRDGTSNGSPIRRIIESGVPGDRIVQIGIADFANSRAYSEWAREQGVHVITRAQVGELGIVEAVRQAREHLAPAHRVHVDVDVDVCDRAVAPACPASLPGGLSADELLDGVLAVARDPRVLTIDITEIDAGADTPDQRTVRLGALIVLRAMLGYALR